MEKFDLLMCCLGNGITVCNKAITEHNDYKIIAHIADCGKINWYIDQQSIPKDAMQRIENAALENRKLWENHLSSMGEQKALYYFLDNVPHNDFMQVIRNMKDSTMAEKLEYLKAAYINAV